MLSLIQVCLSIREACLSLIYVHATHKLALNICFESRMSMIKENTAVAFDRKLTVNVNSSHGDLRICMVKERFSCHVEAPQTFSPRS